MIPVRPGEEERHHDEMRECIVGGRVVNGNSGGVVQTSCPGIPAEVIVVARRQSDRRNPADSADGMSVEEIPETADSRRVEILKADGGETSAGLFCLPPFSDAAWN